MESNSLRRERVLLCLKGIEAQIQEIIVLLGEEGGAQERVGKAATSTQRDGDNGRRMRSMQEAIVELREADPDCRFTLYALRVAVRSGKVACVRCGRKTLVSMDSLYAYLEGEKAPLTERGRQIPERQA